MRNTIKNIFTIAGGILITTLATAQVTTTDVSNYTAENDKMVAYYDNGAVKSSVTTAENNTIAKVDYFDNGIVKEEGMLLNGKKEGKWMMYNADGSSASEAYFSNGEKNRAWKVWDANGKLRYEMFYIDGEKTGTWKIYDESGKLTQEKKY